MKNTLPLLLLCLWLFYLPSFAVNGYAVSAHWNGKNENLYGGYGKIMRYEIRNSKSENPTVLYNGEARYATIDTKGQRVAFIKNSGTIAFVSINGGKETDLAQVPSSKGYLDWPDGDWLYYSKGGYAESGSKEIWKINVNTKENKKVITFSTTMWQWSLANDGDKACIRPSDGEDGGGTGHVYRYLLSSPSNIKQNNSDDLGFGCGNAISPDGSVLMRFDNYSDNSIAFHNWDRNKIKSVSIGTMNGWGKNLGSGFNRNLWSANSKEWICTMQGWDGRQASNGGNQVLYNWMAGEQIDVSGNSNGSKDQNEAGDFWIGQVSTMILKPARIMNSIKKSDRPVYNLLGRYRSEASPRILLQISILD